MKDNIPNIDDSVFIAPGVQIAGGDEIQIGKNSSIWFNSVIRSSGQEVLIGERSNVQDGSVIHTSTSGGTYIGDDVTIGHLCLIHGCTIGNRTLIGMGSLLMNGVKIGNDCIIGAGSLLTQGTVIPGGHMAFGRPAKVIRPLTEEEIAGLPAHAEEYVEEAKKFRE